jgi:hypothetical protein
VGLLYTAFPNSTLPNGKNTSFALNGLRNPLPFIGLFAKVMFLYTLSTNLIELGKNGG